MSTKKLHLLILKMVCILCILSVSLTSCNIVQSVISGISTDDTIEVVCSDTNDDHLCDDCKKILSECTDENIDHKCDVCTKVISVCIEGENHKCSLCSAVMSVCADQNADHKCDVCTKVISVCTEGEDHKCSLCSAIMSVCADENADHKCDACGAALSDCKDTDKNHSCDVCGKTTTECVDENTDHKCDLCGATLSDCEDTDKNHSCDICGKTTTECVDENTDHKCDACGAALSDCKDTDKNHSCDVCGKTTTECVDENTDHKCDLCGATLSDCKDTDKNHSCDICGKTTTECVDGNSDHKCDLCCTDLSECEDKDMNHFCDVCKEKLTNCVDNDEDHECDLCGQTVSICEDKNNDHLCDVCSLSLSSCSDAGSPDHKCDMCGDTISECNFVDRVCTVCGDSTIYKHVVILGVDGAGSFFKDADTPNMDAIFANGAITYEGITESPSISAECWASLLHGVNASVHGITAKAQGSYPIDSDYPSFFRVIHENDPSLELGSYTTWQTINNLIVEDGIGITKVGWSGTDADLTDKICAYVKTSAPTALFVQFDNVDAAGHHYGFGSEEHLDKITETDALIGRIHDAYVEKGILDETLFIVTTDHGGTKVASGSYLGNHGGETPEEKEITFAAVGKTVVNGGEIKDFEIRDTAAIVLYALGYEQPASWTARVPSGLFEGVEASERPVWVKPAKQLSDYVDKTVLSHLSFDDGITDITGNYTTTSKGTLSYSDGYLEKAVNVNNSSITLEDFSIGTNNLTFSTWIKVSSSVGSDPVVFANKSWRSGANAGILVCIHQLGYIHVNVADGTNRRDLKVNYDADALNDWIHLIVVIDRDNNQIRLSINFEELQSLDMKVNLKNVSFDTEYELVIGQDGTGAYASYLKSAIDDFIIFDAAFDMDDVRNLATYYAEKTAEESYRGHITEPTPEKDSNGYITNYIEDKDLLAYLTFDNTIEDTTGNYETNSSTNATYGSGFYGQALQVNKSAVNIEDFNPGANSITFATWLKITKLEGGDPVIFANKSWSSGKNAGILICLHSTGKLRVNIADGTNRTDFTISYPTDILDGWMHLIVVYDVENNEIRVSFDFGDFLIGKLTPENYGGSIDGAYDLAIGEDGTNSYSAYINGYIDEFMIFDGAFVQSDVDNLEKYYNQY